MTKRKQSPAGINVLLDNPQIRKIHHEGQTCYSISDLIRILAETQYPDEYWTDLKRREPALETLEVWLEFECEGQVETIVTTDLAGVFRLIQSIPSPTAERMKRWLAESAVQRLEELENPELAVLRMRKSYEDKGYSRRWIDKRLRGISTRHEVTSEWARRGATQSDQYRALTNALMEGTFGMDVESARRYKNLQRPTQNLRDYMSDLELVLTSLGETAAVILHRNRGSNGFEELLADAIEAGQVAGQARTHIEQGSARRSKSAVESAARRTHQALSN
jgi:DNA-damage-inducible protein D